MNDFVSRFGASKNHTPQVLTGTRNVGSQSMTATGKKVQERNHPLENRVPPPLVVVLIGVAMAVIAWFTPALEFENNVRFVGGGIAIALGVLVVVQGARTFWRNQTTINPVDLESASALVTNGVFRLSRNPMYVGFTAMLVGWAVCLAAPWALVGPVAFVHREPLPSKSRR